MFDRLIRRDGLNNNTKRPKIIDVGGVDRHDQEECSNWNEKYSETFLGLMAWNELELRSGSGQWKNLLPVITVMAAVIVVL